MTEDNEITEPPTHDTDEGAEPTEEPAAESASAGDDERVEPDSPSPSEGPARRLSNYAVYGQLIVHYPERDVTFILDGEAALRIMRIYAMTGNPFLEDVLDGGSNAAHMWVVLDTRRPLAMQWVPGLPTESRTTVDPLPVPRAA